MAINVKGMQLITKSSAQWALDNTVYAARMILVAQDGDQVAAVKWTASGSTFADAPNLYDIPELTADFNEAAPGKAASAALTSQLKTEVDGKVASSNVLKLDGTTSGFTPTLDNHPVTLGYLNSLQFGKDRYQGDFDASGGQYPATSYDSQGNARAIQKGDFWSISVGGTLPDGTVVSSGDQIRAKVNGADSDGEFYVLESGDQATEIIRGEVKLANTADAEGAVNDSKAMTSLKTSQQITARISDQSSAEAGTDGNALMTPLRTRQSFLSMVSNDIQETSTSKVPSMALYGQLAVPVGDHATKWNVMETQTLPNINQEIQDLNTMYTDLEARVAKNEKALSGDASIAAA